MRGAVVAGEGPADVAGAGPAARVGAGAGVGPQAALPARAGAVPAPVVHQGQLPAPGRARRTARLRGRVHLAVCETNRAISEVGKDYGLAGWTVHRVLVAAATDALGAGRADDDDRDR